MTHQVFLSYSSTDQGIADAIVKAMESGGIGCWIASRNIKAGEDYAECILKAISISIVMVVIFSKNSNVSRHVMREVERAIHYGNAIIPFKIDGVNPTKSMEYYFSTVQWLDASKMPVQDHISSLCKRVQKLIGKGDPEVQPMNGKTISSQSIKAYDLACRAEERKLSNPTHAIFWLGSRYLPGFDVFQSTRNLNLQDRQLVDKTLFSQFQSYEDQLGLKLGFEDFFKSIPKQVTPQKEAAVRQSFMNNSMALINDQYDEKSAVWWIFGNALSTLWFWVTKAEKRPTDKGIIARIENTLNSIHSVLQLLEIPDSLKDTFYVVKKDPDKWINSKKLKDWTIGWIAKIEMFLLISETENSVENADMLIEINPELATFWLQKFISVNPDDAQAFFSLGKASRRSFSNELSLEPLFRTDPAKLLVWSMKKSIQLQPDSEWSRRARIVLEKIKP